MRSGQANRLSIILDGEEVLESSGGLVLGDEANNTVGRAVDYKRLI